jgi:hypothetical protein
MKNRNKPNGTAPITSQADRGNKIEDKGLLVGIESHLANGIKLQWAIVRTLQRIDATLNIFAAQKKRELEPEQPKTETAE